MVLRALSVLLFVLIAAAAQGAVVEGLYDVATPVADQGQPERRRAISAALLEMLSRSTGLVEVPRNESVRKALADSGRYYVQYRYEQTETDSGRQLFLVVSFAPKAINALIADSGLPLWSANRPTVVTWLITDDTGQREILGSASEHPVLQGLTDQARRRGVALVVPLMDLEDQFAVPAAAVHGGLAQVLEDGSRRYGADALLIGRVGSGGAEDWSSQWEFWMRDSELELAITNDDPLRVGAAGADLVANELAVRYAVHSGEAGILKLTISAVDSLADYGGLLEYFDRLEFVDSVRIREVARGTIDLDLVTSTEWQRFVQLLDLDDRLAPLPRVIGAERYQMAWRGGADER